MITITAGGCIECIKVAIITGNLLKFFSIKVFIILDNKKHLVTVSLLRNKKMSITNSAGIAIDAKF